MLLFFSDFQYEPWFGSRFVEEDIAQNLMELWRNPPEIDASLHLPSKNEFIPSDFSIRAGETCLDDFANSTSPRCIVDEALMKFWYKLDSTFKVPRANTYFRINLKGGYDNAKSCVLSELFIHLLKDELNEIIYQVNHLSHISLKLQSFVCVISFIENLYLSTTPLLFLCFVYFFLVIGGIFILLYTPFLFLDKFVL